jgi:hypothetical protein
MSPRARRAAIVIAALALALSLGRWGSLFLADRLWEATVSEAVAAAGSRRALFGLGLELSAVLVAALWFALHFTIARHAALPDQAPPEREHARLWPARLPRWILGAAALVLGVLVGAGASRWIDPILLSIDGVRFGVSDPLLGADLGLFLREFPLWTALQHKATLLTTIALGGVLMLYLAGGAVRVVERRIWVSSRARGHLAVLLALLGLLLAFWSVLEPFRLAAGVRGPLLSSEFLLRTLVAEVEAGLGAAAAIVSFFWWIRLRGVIAFAVWGLYGVAVLAGRVLPLHTEAATGDEGWRASARSLDSTAFGLRVAEAGAPVPPPLAVLVPTLWDPDVVPRSAGDSVHLIGAARGWLERSDSTRRAVWLAVQDRGEAPPALVALGDDEVSPAGGAVSWSQGERFPAPGLRSYRDLAPETLRPGAPRILISPSARGVALTGWPKRVMLAWALQSPETFSAGPDQRIGWRLDPGARLRTILPSARWSEPRAQLVDGQLVWTSDGLLTSKVFPSSLRLPESEGGYAMVRPAFLGVVNAASGSVRIFRREAADSLSAAWARILAPLIEPAGDVPAGLRESEPYPRDLVAAQARVLEGPAWSVGRLERDAGGVELLGAPSAGGTEVLVPFVADQAREVVAFLEIRRGAFGDSLRLIRIDSLPIEASSALVQRWERMPFHSQLRDSVRAAGATFASGAVRSGRTAEGPAAYRPAWAIAPSGRAQLVLVNVALGRRIGAGRTIDEAWKNLRGQISPTAVGTGATAILEQARRWMLRADSALRRGDFQELGRALAHLRELLEPPR